MNKNLKLIRFFLFATGLAILCTMPFIIDKNVITTYWASKFIWICSIVIYIAAMIPFISYDEEKGIDGGKIVSLGIYYKGLSVYISLNIGLMIFAAKIGFASQAVFLVQEISTFVLAVYVYFAAHTSTYVNKVEQIEEEKMMLLKTIQAKAEILSVKMANFSNGEQKNKIIEICKEIKYISPCSQPLAKETENKILNILDIIEKNNVDEKTFDELLDRLGTEIEIRKKIIEG